MFFVLQCNRNEWSKYFIVELAVQKGSSNYWKIISEKYGFTTLRAKNRQMTFWEGYNSAEDYMPTCKISEYKKRRYK